MASTLRFDNWENSNGDLINSFENPAIYRGKNLLYNGAMQVAQRGTSETGIVGNSYNTADRWRTVMANMGTWTQTVEADGPTGSGFTKSLKMECTTADAAPAASDIIVISQTLEGQDLQEIKKGTSSAESLMLSFWVKSDTTGTYIASLYDSDNGRLISKSYSISTADTWEQKTITIDVDTTGALDNDNGGSLQVQFVLGAGSDFASGTLATSWELYTAANRAVGQTNLAASTGNYWQITGVQLETGTVANNFDHKSYGVELAECQRYYYYYPFNAQVRAVSGLGNVTAMLQLSFPVTMRTAPSTSNDAGPGIQYYGTSGWTDSTLVQAALTDNVFWFGVNVDTSGVVRLLRNNTGANVQIKFDAEL